MDGSSMIGDKSQVWIQVLLVLNHNNNFQFTTFEQICIVKTTYNLISNRNQEILKTLNNVKY